MPKYLIEATFTAQGLQGLRRDGGTARRATVERAVRSIGGRLESFHFAIGDRETYGIVDLPDRRSAAALSAAVSASGALTPKAVVPMEPEGIGTMVGRSADHPRLRS